MQFSGGHSSSVMSIGLENLVAWAGEAVSCKPCRAVSSKRSTLTLTLLASPILAAGATLPPYHNPFILNSLQRKAWVHLGGAGKKQPLLGR